MWAKQTNKEAEDEPQQPEDIYFLKTQVDQEQELKVEQIPVLELDPEWILENIYRKKQKQDLKKKKTVSVQIIIRTDPEHQPEFEIQSKVEPRITNRNRTRK